MKIICKKAELEKGVQTVLKAVPAKPTQPILENILIEATDSICLMGNDLEPGITMEIDGDVVEKGEITVNAKILSDVVRRMPDDDVILETKEEKEVVIRCKKVKYNLPMQSGTEYPRIPQVEKGNRVWISEFDLKEAIRQTIFSVSNNDSNKIMTGELFEIDGKNMKIVSLDGHRIAVRNLRMEKNYTAKKVVVPGKTLAEIGKIISNDPERMIGLLFTDNHVMFEMEKIIAVSRLIEGEYFKIDSFMNMKYQTKIMIDKKDLQECISRAGILQKRDENKPVVMDIKKGSMELKVATPLGSMDENLPIQVEGKELKIGFNPRFLLDMLRAIDDEQIDVYLNNDKMPCVVRDKESSYLYVILPVNIRQAA